MIDKQFEIDNGESITLPFNIGGLDGFCNIDFLHKDINGFYQADTVIDTPRGRFKQTCYINPKTLINVEKRYIIDILSNRCFDAYVKAIKND